MLSPVHIYLFLTNLSQISTENLTFSKFINIYFKITIVTIFYSYKPSRCPLSKPYLNYDQLQDLARSIPEETVEDVEEENGSREVETVIVTGPSGDMEIKAKRSTPWIMGSSPSIQCTCVTQSGVNFQHVINKVGKNSCSNTNNTLVAKVK